MTGSLPTRRAFRVRGMDCAEETRALRQALARLAGVERLDFDLVRGKLTVTLDPSRVGPADITRAVSATGMRAEPWAEATEPAGGPRDRARLVPTGLSGLCLAAAALSQGLSRGGFPAVFGGATDHAAPGAAIRLLYLAAVVLAYVTILPRAWAAVRHLRPDMHLLMSVAAAGAVGMGEWFEAAAVGFLFSLSIVLESWSVARARRAVDALLSLSPQEATLLHAPGERGGWPDHAQAEHPDRPHEHRLAAAAVQVGARLVVRPGEQVPLDGRILHGRTHVDQSPITGESIPVPKAPGDEVFAGTVNQEGAIEVETTRPASGSTLARIVRLVGEARSLRSPSERFVDRFARVYTPVVMGLALATGVIPPLVLAGGWSEWLYRSLVLLVIACPCALVISTPVSVVSALAAAARQGVLIKGGVFVEAPAHLACVAFDKTGTLTEGRPAVQAVIPLDGHTEAELLGIATAMEGRSGHPLARAIVERAAALGLTPEPASDFVALAGRGAEARVGGRAYWIGSHRLLEERGQETSALHARLVALAADGCSVVIVGTDDHVCGVIAAADRLRPEAAPTVEALHGLAVNRLVLLTGDNEPTAHAVARALGIDDVRAELLPEDKVRAVEELVARHGSVAMAGDGVNDAPAMARSSLGIAMGAAGTDAAIETADVVILSDDLTRLVWLVRHARRTKAIIRQNIVSALAVKALFFGLAYAGWATLWGAIAADMGVSLAVIANALRLLRAGARPAGRATGSTTRSPDS